MLWLHCKESTCQCRRCRFDSWVGKVPWRRKWQPTPVFLPGESLGQRSLAGYGPPGCKESDMTWQHSNCNVPLSTRAWAQCFTCMTSSQHPSRWAAWTACLWIRKLKLSKAKGLRKVLRLVIVASPLVSVTQEQHGMAAARAYMLGWSCRIRETLHVRPQCIILILIHHPGSSSYYPGCSSTSLPYYLLFSCSVMSDSLWPHE